jgi:hypothetical protein
MEKIRCGMVVYTRADDTCDWSADAFHKWLNGLGMKQSINQAKKFNGLDSRTVKSQKNLPAKRKVQQ